ncbi:MAG: hypothetical protein JWO38_3292 [Gemmataceae bacterium]|nr:hypothetical protein [Gemmataceae bacterium]
MNPGALCIYYESAAGLTRDHVPPKALFPKPRPGNLVTVPACFRCNSSAGLDDDYFATARRAFQTAYPLVPPVPTAASPPLGGGLQLGDAVDLTRVYRVVVRVVRGLNFHETGRRFGPGEPVDVFCNATLSRSGPGVLGHLHSEILAPILTLPAKQLGTGVFEYRFWHSPDDPSCSVWLLTFHAAVPFLVTTGTGAA